MNMTKENSRVTEVEIWRTSPYEGYSASTLGNIRNDKTGRILKPGKTKLGYLIVTVGGISRLVHRIIMDTFLPISEEESPILTDVDHINADKACNELSNLRRCTHANNLKSKHRLSLIRHSVHCIDANGTIIMQAESLTKMAELLEVSEPTISAHVNSGKPLSTGLKVIRANNTDKQSDTKEVA